MRKGHFLLVLAVLVLTGLSSRSLPAQAGPEISIGFFGITRDQVYVPRLWLKSTKDAAKTKIASNHRVEVSLIPAHTICRLVIQLKSITDQYFIEGNNGAIFLALPSELDAREEQRRVDYLDQEGSAIEEASLPYFKETILEILKRIAPGVGTHNVAKVTEEIFKAIGTGRLEPIDTQGTIFTERQGYDTLLASWDAIYQQGRWIEGYTLQFSVPLGLSIDEAKKLLEEKGLGMFFHIDLSCTTSNVAIMCQMIPSAREGLECIGKNNQGYEEYCNLKDGSIMVRITAGEFQMGSNEGDNDEKPLHKVYLDAYYIDKYEVTNEQFRRFVEATGYITEAEKKGWSWAWEEKESHWNQIQGTNWRHPQGPGSSILGKMNHPVVQVSWNDAKAYAKWTGKRLSTEAEWEKAARGGLVGKKYPWGDNLPDGTQSNFADKNIHLSWSDKQADDGYRYTAPVGTYPPNGYGLYDLTGNVWEWCDDWYEENYYAYSPPKSPRGSKDGSSRVFRGGGWDSDPGYLRCARRYSDEPGEAGSSMGLRCTRSTDRSSQF